MAEGKPKRRGIGSISQFATLGNKATEDQSTQEPNGLDAMELKSQNHQSPSSPEAKEPSPPNIQDTEHLNVEVSESQAAQTAKESDTKMLEDLGVQESKRLIQISEEELKRLMIEALQSQNTQAPKQQEKPKRLRQTVYLEPDLHKKVRHRIADTGEDISDVVNLALRQLLE